LFLAFELPAMVRARIGACVEPLRPALPAASWVPPERMHLTLAFLGEVEETRLGAFGPALGPVFAAAPRLTLRLAGAGTFPPDRPARVAWIGVEAGQGPAGSGAHGVLASIERLVREVLVGKLGFSLEDRPFHAHVTVARPRRPWGREAVARFRAACGDLAGEWEAVRAVLMESELGRGGAHYAVRQDYALGGAA
jgi:2'-5' RNA ligase